MIPTRRCWHTASIWEPYSHTYAATNTDQLPGGGNGASRRDDAPADQILALIDDLVEEEAVLGGRTRDLADEASVLHSRTNP